MERQSDMRINSFLYRLFSIDICDVSAMMMRMTIRRTYIYDYDAAKRGGRGCANREIKSTQEEKKLVWKSFASCNEE